MDGWGNGSGGGESYRIKKREGKTERYRQSRRRRRRRRKDAVETCDRCNIGDRTRKEAKTKELFHHETN